MAIILSDRVQADTTRKSRETRSRVHANANAYQALQCGEKDGGGGGGIREFAGTMRRSRAPRNRVISAARPNTCPIIFRAAALACRRVRRPGDKGFPCFWYRQLHLPIHPSVLVLVSLSRTAFFRFFGILSPRNKPRDYRCTSCLRGKKKKGEEVEGWL